MDICGTHGSGIAFEGLSCPACDQVDDLKSEIEDLKAQITKHETYIEKLEEGV